MKSGRARAPRSTTAVSGRRNDRARQGWIRRRAIVCRNGPSGDQGGWRGAEAAGPARSVRDRSRDRHERAFCGVRRGDRVSHRGRALRVERGFPRTFAGGRRSGVGGAGHALVDADRRGFLVFAGGPGIGRHRARGPSGGSGLMVRRGGVRRVGGRASAKRGRVGACGAFGIGRGHQVSLGGRRAGRHACPLQHLAGAVSGGRHSGRRAGTAPPPRRSFEPNGAGLFNACGNVWEWTSDACSVRSVSKAAKVRNERARSGRQRVLKGGSFLCHASYCYRYRIAARSGNDADSAASNVGFRVVYDD